MNIRYAAFIICCLVFSLGARRTVLRGSRVSQFKRNRTYDPLATFRQKLAKKTKHHRAPKFKRPEGSKKKTIVVLSCSGGGGHTAVSNGLCQYLDNDYNVIALNALRDIFSPIDTLETLTFGKVNGEDIYNFGLRCGWTNLLGNYSKMGASFLTWRHDLLVKLILGYFAHDKADLIISVMPHINAAVSEACRIMGIPFLVLTNDLDTTNYITGLKPPYAKNFTYALSFDDPELWKKIEAAKIPKDQVVVSGFPVRPEFFEQKNIPKLKKKYAIPTGKPVVMVFMGGAGSQASYRYVRNLARLGMPMHIIVCLGKNERLKRNIRKIMLPEEVTMTLFGYTDKIADLMALSNVLITKPGPNSVCEGLFSEVPMILDLTHGTIWWEQLNIDFMINQGFAEPLTDYKDLASILLKYFKDNSYTNAIKKKMRGFICVRFNEAVKPLIARIITNKG